MARSIMALALAVGLAAVPVRAQIADEAASWRGFTQRLETGAFVSLRLKDGTRIKGTIVEARDADFLFMPRTRLPVAPRAIDYASVDSIERASPGMSPGLKVVSGVAIGVGAFLLLAIAAITAAYD